jgi:crossover junction endodeoxyribonuclease RuvC
MTASMTSRVDGDPMPLFDASGGRTAPGAAQGEGAAPGALPRVIGIDLSLTSTGVAGGTWAETIGGGSLPRKGATLQQKWTRIRRVRAHLLEHIDGSELVVIESPAYSKGADPGAHERAALWWLVVGRCLSREIPIAEVSTSTLKVYATGRGNAKKEDVVQEVQRRRPDLTFRGNDQADAITLAAMGLDALGHPPVPMPQTHRRALDSVHWPEVSR